MIKLNRSENMKKISKKLVIDFDVESSEVGGPKAAYQVNMYEEIRHERT